MKPGSALFYLSFLVTFFVLAQPLHAAELFFEPSEIRASVGDLVRIEVKVKGVQDLFGSPFHLLYAPAMLEVVKVEEGGFFKKAGKKAAFLNKIDRNTGRVVIGLSRVGQVEGISGSGALIAVTLRAKKPGSARLAFEKIDFRDSKLQPIPVHIKPATIHIGDPRAP